MTGIGQSIHWKHLSHLGEDAFANLLGSVGFILAILVLRLLIHRILIRNPKVPQETRRRWIVQTRNALVLLTVFGLIVIWATEIRSLALSLVAVAVAIVIATKEVLLCLAGTFVKTSSRAFSLGDRIEIGTVRGDVIDQGLFTTSLVEIGPQNLTHQYTGRAIVLPNSRFLSEQVINESFTAEYVLHVFTVPMDRWGNWKLAGEILLEASTEACRPFSEDAERHLLRHHRERGLEPPSLIPRVHFKLLDRETLSLVVRVVTPARQKGRVEQEIMRSFLDRFPNEGGTPEQSNHRV